MRAALVSAFVDNPVGRLLEDLILQGGVDMSMVRWVEDDGIGRSVRNGLNFTERGYGARGAVGCSDRGHSAASQIAPGNGPGSIDWDDLFGRRGVRWFHTGGIYASLSGTTPQVVAQALQAARRHGTITSYDLNYRPSLWKSFGGQKRCQEVNRSLVPDIDILIGNEEDFTACLGLHVEGADEHLKELPIEGYKAMIQRLLKEFPSVKATATTLRTVKSATVNDWGALCWHDGKFHEATMRENLEIMDRVGGGDSFASGLAYGFMTFNDAAKAVEYGAAHGALAMTTPGDTSMARLKEVEKLVKGGSARVDR
jgi:2-dehydro-3-deoxygluconokinase